MSSKKNEPQGCGCGSIPFSLILLMLGGGYWWFSQPQNRQMSRYLPPDQTLTIPGLDVTLNLNPPEPVVPPMPTPLPTAILPPTDPPEVENLATTATSEIPEENSQPQSPWYEKEMRGIYLSRYQVTNNASEDTIRKRVRYYRSQGFNTLLHGVWGNACTIYKSDVMAKKLGYDSCPNKFQTQWLDWLIDEAHKQGMQVHAYFEKGIKIDKNSPLFDLAMKRKWTVPGIDRTYRNVEHHVLDVSNPEVSDFFRDILAEFAQKYPTVDAVQWDDYLGYHAELPGDIDRTDSLTQFSQAMIQAMKKANPEVSFDLCHHNPYWSKRYFAADWKNWDVDRVFVQAYNEANFDKELDYARKHAGIAITDAQLHRLPALIKNKKIKSVLVFPLSGQPESTAANVNRLIKENLQES